MATVRQYRDRWVADFRDQHGRRRIEAPRGPFENRALEKRAAHELLAKRAAEVKANTFAAVSERLTFGAVADRYLASRTKARQVTVDEYRDLIDAYLRPYFGARKVEAITAHSIEQFRDELRAAVPEVIQAARRAANEAKVAADPRARAQPLRPGARTVNKLLTLLSMILRYANRHEWAPRNAADGIDKLPQPKGESRVIETNVLNPDELRRAIEHAVAPYQAPISFAVYSGARQSEVLGLRWSDIDWNRNEAHIRRRYRLGEFAEPKTTASARVVELPAELVASLKRWKLACPKGDGTLDLCFPDQSGKPMHASALTARGFKGALRRAGIRAVRFHDLRHSFASNLLAAGVDVVTVSRLMGHSSPQVTLTIYSHTIPKQRHGASELLAKLMRGESKWKQNGNSEGQNVAFEPADAAKSLSGLEASAGIEPAYTDLQSAA